MSFRTYALQFAVAALAVVVCLWTATQWAAAMLGHQAALGPAWIDAVGLKIYAPWQLFVWWLAFDAQAPDVFARAGTVAAFGGLASGAVAIGGAARRASRKQQATTYGSARWADVSEVRSAELLGDAGVVLGLYDGRYLRHDGPEHVLVVAPTRSGKGVGLVLPTLLTWNHSAVIHDIKGENWALTSGWRSRFSHCLLFDPTDPRSARFNPLLEVRKGAHEVRDVQNIADILVDPEGARERRDHWEKTAHALLTGAILHVLYAEQEKTLARVATFLADPSRSILRTLKIMLTTNHVGTDAVPIADPVVASIARELLNKSDNERSGVVSTAMSFLGLYRDPLIAANTARSDWRIADLMHAERPVSLYLVVPPSDISRTKPLVRLVLHQIARQLTETLGAVDGDAPRRRLLLMVDEFPALGRLDFFESSLAFLAGYGVRAFLVAQSLHQIDKAYGQHHAILDNCHVRVAFAPNDERTAKRLSDALGTATELRAQKNLSGRRFSAWLSHTSVSEQRTLAAIQGQLQQGNGVALSLQATQSAYERLFPREISASLSSDAVLRNAQQRWEEQYASLRRAALLQGQIGDGIDSDSRLLGQAMDRSRMANGALEVAQAGNELSGLSVKQALALQSLLAAQHRADTLTRARDVASEEEARQRFKSFLGSGSAYSR